MTKRRKASILVSGKKRFFDRHSNIVLVSSATTGAATGTLVGTVYAQIATTGISTGAVYIAIDTSGTGSIIG